MSSFHKSVLLNEVIHYLEVKKDKKYIDATLGGGGHAEAILDKGGIVLGIDVDQDALDYVNENQISNLGSQKLTLAKGNFRNIDKIASSNNFENVKGIIFDLGVSSYQINTPNRGFSFMKKGPLDMRMDKSSPVTAEALVNLLQKGELDEIFNKYGQESRFRAISNNITSTRRIKAINSTEDLSEVVARAYGIRGKISDFTKNKINQKVFQALRIAVNDELGALEEALPKAVALLESRGRIAVISFHSLEDRITKSMFNKFEKEGLGVVLTKKPILPSFEEVRVNSRAKSAKLRVFERN